MLPKNFPGRVKARRVGALERLLQSTVYKGKRDRSGKGRRKVEVA